MNTHPPQTFVQIPADDVSLVIGALNSLGTALADHRHQWTDGERCIYELATEILVHGMKKAARAARNVKPAPDTRTPPDQPQA